VGRGGKREGPAVGWSGERKKKGKYLRGDKEKKDEEGTSFA